MNLKPGVGYPTFATLGGMNKRPYRLSMFAGLSTPIRRVRLDATSRDEDEILMIARRLPCFKNVHSLEHPIQYIDLLDSYSPPSSVIGSNVVQLTEWATDRGLTRGLESSVRVDASVAAEPRVGRETSIFL